jgi:hypothetical protein
MMLTAKNNLICEDDCDQISRWWIAENKKGHH